MPYQEVEDCIEVRQHFNLAGGEEAINVFHVECSIATQDAGLFENLADAFKDAWVAELKPFVTDECTLTDITCTSLDTEDGMSLQFFYNEVGDNEIEQLPQQCAGLIKWVTAKRGRSWHGRSYIAGFCEDQSNGVNFSAPAQTAMNDYAAALLVAGQTDLCVGLAVVSRFTNNTERAAGVMEPITAGRASSVIRTMRTRAKY